MRLHAGKSFTTYRIVHHLVVHLVPGGSGIRLRSRVGKMHTGGNGRAQVRSIMGLGRANIRQRSILQNGMRVVLAMLRNGTGSLQVKQTKDKF